jgi:small acid-soluble spore protein F (minor alpha/beta-type SASP)
MASMANGAGNQAQKALAKSKDVIAGKAGKIAKTAKNSKAGKNTAKTAKKKKPLTPQEKAKLKIARELGLYEQIRAEGWGSLSAKECGQIGGILSKKIRQRG